MASREPVDAPDGEAARPTEPHSRITSASTVGLPRESIIWRALISLINDIFINLFNNLFLKLNPV